LFSRVVPPERARAPTAATRPLRFHHAAAAVPRFTISITVFLLSPRLRAISR
jgi:hypothetical protein